MSSLSYNEQIDRENVLKLRKLTLALPPYCKDFFRGIEPRTQSRTRIAYAYDLNVFFQFLLKANPVLEKKYKKIRDIPIEVLENLSPVDLEEYMEYLKYRKEEEKEIVNKGQGIQRKLSTLKSLYRYLYRTEKIEHNPTERILMPKTKIKDIVHLDEDEVEMMLSAVESGRKLTTKQRTYHDKTKLRDLTLLSLMLGTGIRVSECVGLNIQDVDLKNDGIKILRKGGKEATVHFGDEVEELLTEYMEYRKSILAAPGHEDALFLSMQKKRLGVRSVEKMVKKYALSVETLKKITPHKLRSTYGTNLYKETGDIYLVADVLGHTDVNTTKRHYAAIEEDRRKSARNKIKLRKQ